MSEKDKKKVATTALQGNAGFLHQTQEKKSEKSPDLFGTAKIGGVVFSLAGWTKTKEGKDGEKWISLNVDKRDDSEEKVKMIRESNFEKYQKERKLKENKDKFILIVGTGTMHRQTDPEKVEDYFGTLRLDAGYRSFKGYMTTGKDERPILRLEFSDGLKDADERAALADSFI